MFFDENFFLEDALERQEQSGGEAEEEPVLKERDHRRFTPQ